MHECYFLNVVLLPKKTPHFYNALCVAFYHLPQPHRPPFRLVSELCKHGGMQKLCHVQIPSCLRRGQNKCSAPPACAGAAHWPEKLMQNLLMLRGMQSLHHQTVSVLLACQLNREKTTSLKWIVPWLAIIGCQGAEWIRNTPQIEVCKSLNGALNSHHSHTGVTTWQRLNQYNQLCCWFPDHTGEVESKEDMRITTATAPRSLCIHSLTPKSMAALSSSVFDLEAPPRCCFSSCIAGVNLWGWTERLSSFIFAADLWPLCVAWTYAGPQFCCVGRAVGAAATICRAHKCTVS